MASEIKDEFQCRICLGVLEVPVFHDLCSNHFCSECINGHIALNTSQPCPVCRQPIEADCISPNLSLQRKIAVKKYSCSCGETLQYSQYNSHQQVCTHLKSVIKRAVSLTSKPNRKVVNRHTYKCPCCEMKHLDRAGLIKHFKRQHKGMSGVCPICAVMPWGDPSYVTSNLLRHLKTRHKFDYDTFIDFELNEQEMLNKVIEASLIYK